MDKKSSRVVGCIGLIFVIVYLIFTGHAKLKAENGLQLLRDPLFIIGYISLLFVSVYNGFISSKNAKNKSDIIFNGCVGFVGLMVWAYLTYMLFLR